MLAALMLFIPSQTYSLFALNFSAAMLLGISFILMLRSAPGLEKTSFDGIASRGKFPMGISIAGAGLMHPFVINVFF
jgi:prepilin peptidase CpaA